ncbi:hypothetical protein GE061_019495 [Apolygus lucorum]|uniref:DNA polymerase epsilon subunit n=1 Tax=Apolygus lucorum TaxID=248454 RepID=A0A6A4JVB1_APOLU|nr:hypothetical protein GE061_019495 [Apolygus lucorum]
MADLIKLRKRIVSIFQLNGFTIRGDACDFLLDNLKSLEEDEREVWIERITDYCQKQLLTSPVVEKTLVEAAILDSCRSEVDDEEQLLTVISAFEVPRFKYNIDRKKFLPTTHQPELFCQPSIKGLFYKERYTILYQRTLRNKLFHGAANDVTQFKLRPVEYLLSTSSKVENVVLLGLLTQLKEGKFYLEDPSGVVELDLSETTYHDGLFADCCFVLAEGSYQDEVFTVQAIGLPPRENTQVSRVYFGNANTFGGPSKETLRNSERLKKIEQKLTESMIVFIADCWLDQPKVLEKLGILFRGYAHSPPTAFVLMGNFLSSHKGSQHLTALKEAFNALGDLISQSSELMNHSKFIIVPGQTDSPAANILPRPALPELLVTGLKSHVKSVILATNPCRIQYCTQEIVVAREDLVTKLCRNSVHFPVMKDIGSHFAKTIISQAHLVPLPLNVCPVYWDFDAGLQLYPCPDVIVVADQHKSFSEYYNNCHVINPGPFSKGEFVFKVYYPASNEVEDCQIPDDS